MKKNNKGVLTVEAAFVVPLVVLCIYGLSMLMNIVYIYDSVQSSINNSANLVASNAYLIGTEGLNNMLDEADQAEEEGKQEGDVAGMFQNICNEVLDLDITEGIDMDAVKGIILNPNNAKTLLEAARNSSDNQTVNMVLTIANIMIAMAFDDVGASQSDGAAIRETLGIVVKEVARNNLISELSGGTGKEDDADKKLKALGVKDGVNGIKYDGTEFKIRSGGNNRKDEIVVKVSYTISLNLGFIEDKEIKIYQRAVVRPWTGN